MTDLEESFRLLFEMNMGIQQGERIVVFSDAIRPDETLSTEEQHRRSRLHEMATALAGFAESQYGNAGFISFPATTASGAEPPETLWYTVFGANILSLLVKEGLLSRLLAKEATRSDLEKAKEVVRGAREAVADVVIALANNSTSHTTFRALVNEAGGRFASLPHFDPDMFYTSMRVDWQALADRTARLAAEINRAESILIETTNGTNLHLSKKGRTAAGDDGLLHAPGSFGNLPAGEVYLAPLECTTEGVMVIEYAPNRKLASPLSLVVKEGNVVEIVGHEPYKFILEQTFAENAKNRNIAELGIGTNDRATRPDNILEAEKILGTIHIALGDNSGFGGTVKTPFHEDYVFYEPTVTAVFPDGTQRKILYQGALSLSPEIFS